MDNQENKIIYNKLHKLIQYGDLDSVAKVIYSSQEWFDTILPALREFQTLDDQGIFDSDENKAYYDKILMGMVISAFYIGYQQGKFLQGVDTDSMPRIDTTM